MPERHSTIVVGKGKRAKVWGITEVWAEHPDPQAHDRMMDALVRFALPKAREIIAAQQAERDAEARIPEYVAEGL
jgi:hypothetical protein